jgi:hypothetical protein
MRVILWSCLLCLSLSACSLSLRPSSRPIEGGEGEAQLLNIRIERWGEVRFSGLLALRQAGEGMYYVLLDATGVKLLEVAVAGDGKHRVLHAKGALQDSGLDEYLAVVLARIYLNEPAALPCTGTWMYRICEEETSKGVEKYCLVGPLSIWEIVTERAKDRPYGIVTYRQPWIGVVIHLEPVKFTG